MIDLSVCYIPLQSTEPTLLVLRAFLLILGDEASIFFKISAVNYIFLTCF